MPVVPDAASFGLFGFLFSVRDAAPVPCETLCVNLIFVTGFGLPTIVRLFAEWSLPLSATGYRLGAAWRKSSPVARSSVLCLAARLHEHSSFANARRAEH